MARIGHKHIPFDHYYKVHVKRPQTAIFETVSDTVFVLDSIFTEKGHYFHATLQEARDAFNNVLGDLREWSRVYIFVIVYGEVYL